MKVTNYPFYTAYTHLMDVYGIDMPEDLFETYAMIAWHYIGNKDCRYYRTKIYPKPNGEGQWEAKIPCNAVLIEAITTNSEDFTKTSTIGNRPNMFRSSTENMIESGKTNMPAFYQSGAYVNYHQVGDMLYFDTNFGELNVLYKGIVADEEGLPFLNFKEVEAIACYCAYTYLFKKAMGTMDQNTMQVSAALEQKWKIKCTQARVPEYINQNEMDAVLDAKTTWDRKIYGLSFKPRTT